MSDGFEVGRVRAGGLDQSFVLWGEPNRATMMLLHGLTGHARMWDAFARSMTSRYRIIALDQRGHGDTEWPQPSAYGTTDFVGDLRALADASESNDSPSSVFPWAHTTPWPLQSDTPK